MLKIDVSRFTATYAHLNQTQQDFPLSRHDIARAYMTVGYPKLHVAINKLGIFRFLEILFKAFTYIEIANTGYFRLTRVFATLDPSEQRVISYFIGQSIAKLFAENKLHCKIVDNVNNHKNIILFNSTSKPIIPKVQLYNSTKNAKEPDLLGIDKNSEYHILEAKGYSSGFNEGQFQHAINQVSRVNTVNLKIPLTKSACFFDLSNSPFIGTIVDPDADDKELNISFDQKSLLDQYYSVFNLKKLSRKTYWTIKLQNYEFALLRLFPPFRPFYYYGVEHSIFEKVNRGQVINISDIPNISDIEINKTDGKTNFSIGPDAIIFLEINNPLRQSLMQIRNWV